MIITLSSLKGGVGKTGLCVFLAQAFKATGLSVLCIDLDPNNNLTDYFLRSTGPEEIEKSSVAHVLAGSRAAEKCIIPAFVDVIGCTLSLALAEIPERRRLAFGPAIARLRYDVVLIDTPPAHGPLLSAGMAASDLVLVPLGYSRWSAQAFLFLANQARHIRPVATLVNATQAQKLKASCPGDFLRTIIKRSAAVKTACDNGRPLAMHSKSFQEFKALAEEIRSLL